ncbi:hypothetical protein BN2497_5791 [Janthinobacterium sp. CG23_2]|nr:hypothetical protein BN2497_5791 [Janthinobacterium sp. CG23_2]CUU29293.1 hypothetical protein BN3177_5791 [Janthinobacterium sp. CG23_2]
MSTYFDPAVEAMDLKTVRAEMNALCAEINAANGFVDTFSDNRIADLRRRSKALGEETTLEAHPTLGSYVVKP